MTRHAANWTVWVLKQHQLVVSPVNEASGHQGLHTDAQSAATGAVKEPRRELVLN